ncbi:acyl-ACP--UDP-N-acetylglucosamine O-acyltransferase [Desulfobulbus oligotrophicus]|jgi:UDP-N-acetylglucosamine acyltransferase|uniref:Acyl-[acyl-carrier-protein]--UDP-N-acetylglucosamine O-acyltransferase n=1 Tax=Desulfobulbus oligotrophicus TaxID=1909699 RepID=A0A7T5VFF7_9BACT|nr:acyl-ACP--UDP-N-acetylglucosamine O-acyltransferase [Desulfobulbus oligotrophicus]MDY0390703.1 acyl-ACP--UDP-N-acetylglucosamine O-acyltransferase [Desulfobulbus oligotrophicus]QQG66751.1 acyl-ACP--UDP-N-acetylglucosamine O-acyltransferase [Desulfobulbus oligotrophicus]
MPIHPTAVIDPKAQLDSSVIVDPYAVIDGPVSIGPETRICAHTVVSGHTTIGARNTIGSFATIGGPPQDMHYKDEPTELIIGDGNQIREYVSIHRATAKATGKTVIGNSNMIMAYCHIAHDCVIADHVIMANVATLAGHVEIGSHANLGGLVAVHQFCRIGEYAYIGGMSGIGLDVPPYVIMEGTRNQMRIASINKIGLRRASMERETIKKLEEAFKILFRSPEILLKDALAKLEEEMGDCAEVQKMVQFFHSSKRGVVKRTLDD